MLQMRLPLAVSRLYGACARLGVRRQPNTHAGRMALERAVSPPCTRATGRAAGGGRQHR
jgi:hypothetical protein